MFSKLSVLSVMLILLCANVSAGEAYDAAKATGTIKGTVLWDGPELPVRKIDVSPDPACPKCRANAVLVKEDAMVKDGKLANVVVYVSKGAEKWNFDAVTLPNANVSQKCCQYIPHVQALKTGQKLDIESSDPFAHNIHIIPKENKETNVSQSAPGIHPTHPSYDTPELGIKVQCDVHSWMTSFICVFDHSLFAVSKEDGSFEIKLPPGKYTLSTWQENPKKVAMPEPVEVTVEDGKAAEVKLTFKKK